MSGEREDFTHLDEEGRASMVDVGGKVVTERRPSPGPSCGCRPATAEAIIDRGVPKGDVLAAARIAGIQAAKRTDELIPLCHPLPLSFVGVEAEVAVGGGGHDHRRGARRPPRPASRWRR